MKIQFLGANHQVTGSRTLLEAGGLRMLIDCGMYQERAFLERNWARSPVPVDSIDYLLLTHAHLDHTGLIPRLVAEGFKGVILATAATRDVAAIILRDAAHIQQEDAHFKRKRHEREGRKPPRPVEPLFVDADVEEALPLFRDVPYSEAIPLNDAVSVTYHDAGHILGSSILEIVVREGGTPQTILFTGDLGQRDKPIIKDPTYLEHADYVIMESTYGNRNHPRVRDVEDELCDVINSTVDRGGNIVIPTFAVERAQELTYDIGRLLEEDRIPNLLVFLDSPMAVDVTEVFRRHHAIMDQETHELLRSGQRPLRFRGFHLMRSASDSKSINRIRGSCIIMASSGMCTAGRIKHHLVRNISREESSIVFVGYQAHGTLGREIVEGRKSVRIHGALHEVKARIAEIHGFSAHADQGGLIEWVAYLKNKPKQVFLVHGEHDASTELGQKIRQRLGCHVDIPNYQQEFEL